MQIHTHRETHTQTRRIASLWAHRVPTTASHRGSCNVFFSLFFLFYPIRNNQPLLLLGLCPLGRQIQSYMHRYTHITHTHTPCICFTNKLTKWTASSPVVYRSVNLCHIENMGSLSRKSISTNFRCDVRTNCTSLAHHLATIPLSIRPFFCCCSRHMQSLKIHTFVHLPYSLAYMRVVCGWCLVYESIHCVYCVYMHIEPVRAFIKS